MVAHSSRNYPQTVFPVISPEKGVRKKDKYIYAYKNDEGEVSLDLHNVVKVTYEKHHWYGVATGAPQSYDLHLYLNEQEKSITFINFSNKALLEVLETLKELEVESEKSVSKPVMTIGGFRV